MNPISMETLGGLPIERFVNRRIKARIPDQGICVVKCIEALWGKMKVEITVKGTKRHHLVPLTECNPNWTENTDLREEANSIMASPDALQGLKDELDRRLAPSVPKPPSEPVKAAPAAIPEPLPVGACSGVFSPPPSVPAISAYPVLSKPAAGGTRLDIDPQFDPTWIDDYRILQQTLQENDALVKVEKELKKQLSANTEMVEMCLSEMARKGVRIVPGESAVVVPKPELVLKPAPTRPFQIAAPCVNATPKKPDGRANKATPEDMKRRKHAIHRVFTTLKKGEEVNIKEVLSRATVPFFSSTHALVTSVADNTPGIHSWINGKKITFTREG